MIITCQECNSSFNVEDSLIKETGSKVRCSKCENIFVAYPQSPDDDLLLGSDEQLPDSDENLDLEDIDSTPDDFSDEEESFETTSLPEDADDELGLGLGLDPQPVREEEPEELSENADGSDGTMADFENTMNIESDPSFEDMLEDTTDALDQDIDLYSDESLETMDASMATDELPNLEEISGLDDDPMAVDDSDALIENFDTDLEADNGASIELEASTAEETEDSGLDLQLDNDEETQGIDKSNDDDLLVDDIEDVALSDLDLEEDTPPMTETDSKEDSEDLDLDSLLDQDAVSQGNDDVSSSDMLMEETDELDLSDLDLEDDAPLTAETTLEEGSEDLDLNLLLDQDSESQEDGDSTDPAMAMEETDELDLSDLDLEDDTPLTAETAPEENSGDLDLDLLLDQNTESQEDDDPTDPAMAMEETDELDLSDLDLEGNDTVAAEDAAGGDSEELNLDMDLESETAVGETENLGDELDLSDLEEIIDTDVDEADAPVSRAADVTASADEDDELDFSDLENILESNVTPEASSTNDEADELDLQFDIGDPVASDTDTDAPQDGLLDIEKVLEDSDDTEEKDLDLQADSDSALQETPEAEEESLELDFDLESELQEKEELFEGGTSADEQLESNLLNSDNAEMEDGEFETKEFEGAVTTDEFATDELLATGDTYERTDAPLNSDETPTAPAAMMPKSRSKKPALVALLLLFLAGGILVVPNMLGIKIPYVSDIKIPYLSDLKIPYVSEKLNPEVTDTAGNLKIIPLAGTISARFIDDSQGNQRFVIHGKIKNDYDHPRSFIKVTGKIYQKGGKLAKSETVYCGNVLSDSELTGMKIAAVNKRLDNRFGDKKSNLKVKTGKTIPFMIVFDKLPQNLDEYTVEVDGSSL